MTAAHHHNLTQPGLTIHSDPRNLLPTSPCFVHAHLDTTLSSTGRTASNSKRDPSRPRSSQPPASAITPSSAKTPRPYNNLHFTPPPYHPSQPSPVTDEEAGQEVQVEDEEEEEEEGNFTRQLAETATSVREMSKQLGRTRIKNSIRNILIITKARDNQLIRLTRELAIWLMSQNEIRTPPPAQTFMAKKLNDLPTRPLVVYVDHQLKRSSRFDRAGIERDHPEWFLPLATRFANKRRFSRAGSLSSVHSSQSTRSRNSSISTASDAVRDEGQLRYWTAEMCAKSPELFDLVITLGGDGTVLYASWLFQQVVPPIVPFALGSLGFLTNFDFVHHQRVLSDAMQEGVRVNLRMRFSCTVYRASSRPCRRRAIRSGRTGEILMNVIGKSGWEAIESESESAAASRPPLKRSVCKGDKEIACFSTYPAESFEVLNELVVDRGPSPYVSLLELFGDEHHMTTVQADGLTVSTPTGSTAYSLSAGGSLVHPEIPALLITPICPHTLSFRPMLLPDTMDLRICVPFTSRSTAWASFDGRGRVELRQGDHIKVTASAYPFPTVCADNQSKDWFHAISRTLKWNERQRQKSFVVVEEERSRKDGKSEPMIPSMKIKRPDQNDEKDENHEEEDGEEQIDDEEDEEEEEEEEVYDIDDLSSDSQLGGSPIRFSHDPNPGTKLETSKEKSHALERTPTEKTSTGSSLGTATARQLIDHDHLGPPNIYSNVKMFTVRGLDTSSSSDGSVSDS